LLQRLAVLIDLDNLVVGFIVSGTYACCTAGAQAGSAVASAVGVVDS